MEGIMPTEDCWKELGALRSEMNELKSLRAIDEARIAELERDKVRITTIGGLIAVGLTSLGVLFADPIRHLGSKLLGE
jgi:hypothetical protein